MKKNFLILTAALLVTFGAVAKSIPGAASDVAVVNNGTTLKLYYKAESEADVKVSIMNESGMIVFSEVIKDVDGFVRPYDLSNIPAGAYTIQVADRNATHEEKISVGITPKANLANLYRVKGEEGKYLLTIPSKESKDITVRILADDQVIHNEVVAISSDFARIYNLTKVKGDVTFEVKDQKGNITVVNY